MNLRDYLVDSDAKGYALPHFNVSDLSALRAIVFAAKELNKPVMIGVSEGERQFVGVKEIAALVKAYKEELNLPIFLNADHTHSLEGIKAAAEAGFDEVLFDGAKLPFEENLRQTKEAVAIAKAINPEIIVEGELGYIGSSSEILKETPEGASLNPEMFTKPEEAVRFVKETGVDVFSPAVGNMHGLLESMITGEVKKRLDIQRIGEIKKACGVFLTLHGGSGTADEDFTAAIKAGINIVHINTEIRLAWRRGLEKDLEESPKEVAPYKLLDGAEEEIKKVVLERMKLFYGIK